MTYLVPGIIAMTVFNMSFMQGITIIWDKQFGFLKEILVAPASRTEAILGRITGGALMAMIQGVIILRNSSLNSIMIRVICLYYDPSPVPSSPGSSRYLRK